MIITRLRVAGALALAAGALAAAGLIAQPAAAATANPSSVIYQWYTNGGGILSGVPYGGGSFDAPGLNGETAYTLSNYDRLAKVKSAVKAEIGAHHQTFGVDLDWGAHGSWQFVRENGSMNYAPPTDGETVALYNTEGGYLVYGHQTFGVRLAWDRGNPYDAFQWIVNQGDPNHFSLYNTKEHDYLIYHHQTFGVDLQWLRMTEPSSPQPAGNGTVQNATVWLNEQTPIEGYVPYLGYYGGGGTKAVLTSVTNPGPSTLLFIKPNEGSADCGTPADVITLGPHQTMTAAQVETEWNSSQPSLSSRLPFPACVASSSSIVPMVPVNVTYRNTG